MAEILIKVENVTKKYKDTKALDNVSMEFEENKIHGIIGRNGSGKTVLFKCISGLTPITSGKIVIAGKDISKGGKSIPKMGLIIETPGFLPNFNGYANLKYLASIQNKIGKKEIEEAMIRVGLDPKSRKWVSKYSLGMKQRLGIAQAIMENPDILILDEPTNGLDNHGVLEFRDLIQGLKSEGKTILIASHNAEDIRTLCDSVIELDRGKIITDNVSVQDDLNNSLLNNN